MKELNLPYPKMMDVSWRETRWVCQGWDRISLMVEAESLGSLREVTSAGLVGIRPPGRMVDCQGVQPCWLMMWWLMVGRFTLLKALLCELIHGVGFPLAFPAPPGNLTLTSAGEDISRSILNVPEWIRNTAAYTHTC